MTRRIVITATIAIVAALMLLIGCRTNSTGGNTVNIYGGAPDTAKSGTAEAINKAKSSGAISVTINTGEARQDAGKAVDVNPALNAAASQGGNAATGATGATGSATVAKPQPAATPSSTITPPAATPSSSVTPATAK